MHGLFDHFFLSRMMNKSNEISLFGSKIDFLKSISPYLTGQVSTNPMSVVRYV
jgi:hypothetical protein